MKIIITEEQQTSVKRKLQKMVKELGWETTSKAVGGPKNLATLGFDDDPFDFLNMFNDFDIVQSEDKAHWTVFKYGKGANMLLYDRKINVVFINFYVIWSFLREGFGLDTKETQEITKKWLGKVYDIKGINTWHL